MLVLPPPDMPPAIHRVAMLAHHDPVILAALDSAIRERGLEDQVRVKLLEELPPPEPPKLQLDAMAAIRSEEYRLEREGEEKRIRKRQRKAERPAWRK